MSHSFRGGGGGGGWGGVGVVLFVRVILSNPCLAAVLSFVAACGGWITLVVLFADLLMLTVALLMLTCNMHACSR